MQWTTENTARLEEYLASIEHIPAGLGTKEAACSVAAIRLAWDGVLSDEPPPCMSRALAQWIIVMQDVMPASIRDSAEWRGLLPLAAGTGREREAERVAVIMDWLWETVLPLAQPVADEDGFGAEWRTMCDARTEAAADAAEATAARAAAKAAADAAFKAANAAKAAAYAAYAAEAAKAAAYAAHVTIYTAYAATRTGREAAAWDVFDPVGTLRKIIAA